jgi:hypothetical protein
MANSLPQLSLLSGSVRLLRLPALRCSAGWGKLCFSSGTCGWLTRLLLSEMVWRVVVLTAFWAMEQGRKRLWSLLHAPPRQGSAAQQAISKASTSFRSALLDFAPHDRPVQAKSWDEVGPDHLFFSHPGSLAPVPSGCASPISTDGMLFQCFAWQASYSTQMRASH